MAPVLTEVLAERQQSGARAQVHLRAVMADADEWAWRRRLRLRGFRTAADWQAHVDRTRDVFRQALGPLPAPGPLRVTRTGLLERSGYVVEKLLIETQPDFFATANLYLPARRTGKAPAVLNPVGHWANSKAEDVEQARCVGLARKGYVALIWDPLGQGERSQYWDDSGAAPWAAPSTYEHTSVGNSAILLGSTVIATLLSDGVRMLDYLVSRPEVDAGRIGCTGVSGGGTYTMFLGCFDRRIKATVPVCSTSALERKHRQGQIGELCQNPLRAYPDSLDMADLFMAHAPAAIRIIGTRYDLFPLNGLRDAALDVQDCYAALGIPERADLQVVDAHHEYNQQQRELMYAWFNRWLEHDAPVAEEPFTPDEPRTLWCTSTGQCLTAGVGRTVPDLLREFAAERAVHPPALASRSDAVIERDRVLSAARAALGTISPLTGAPPVMLTPGTVGETLVERFILEARPDVPLPALLFQPSGATSPRGTPTVVLLDERGKAAEAGAGGLAPTLAALGVRVCTVDLRGWGETAWKDSFFGWSQDRRHTLSADTMLSYVSYMLGEWHVTQRVQDATAVLAYLRGRADVDSQRLYLCGLGGGAIVALHAAVHDGQLAGVAALDALASYRSIVDAPRSTHPAADFVPGALLHYDLPLLAGSLAPARFVAFDPLDATGQTLPSAAATAAYADAAALALHLDGDVLVEYTTETATWAERLVRWLNAGPVTPVNSLTPVTPVNAPASVTQAAAGAVR